MKIQVMPFLSRKGNRVGKAAILFDEGPLNGFMLVGFTICDDKEKGMFVQFPSSRAKVFGSQTQETKPYFFLRPSTDGLLDGLETAILDVYDTMTGFNHPTIRRNVTTEVK